MYTIKERTKMLLKNNIIDVYKNLRIKSNQNLKIKIRQSSTKMGGIENFIVRFILRTTRLRNKKGW